MKAHKPLLVVFAGLPGAGKTRIARAVAARLSATFLRVDTFESAVAHSLHPVGDNPVGYLAAEWVAQDQLVSGRDVVVDACNDVDIARAGWRRLDRLMWSRLRWVEVVCSDPAEHRRRVENRSPDWPGHRCPTWEQVRLRAERWEQFSRKRLLVDNVGEVDVHVETVLEYVRTGRLV